MSGRTTIHLTRVRRCIEEQQRGLYNLSFMFVSNSLGRGRRQVGIEKSTQVFMDVVSFIVVVRYFSDFITTLVDVETTLDELKVEVCKRWLQFTPLGICFFFREGGKDLPIDCDYLLQALTSLTHSKKKTSFDIFLENVTDVASSSSSREASSIYNGSSTSSINN
ncbi:hypothetical protein C5167_016387 [Papaver somniferum]|nr:hypothetical protein C5167_016387 [Papaver somniferum]